MNKQTRSTNCVTISTRITSQQVGGPALRLALVSKDQLIQQDPSAALIAISSTSMLVVTEVAEAAEGVRKNCPDDKLPHRSMLEVELADVFIRIFDIAGAHNLDLGGAIQEKLEFNANRPDHKLENRNKEGGKQF